MDGNRGLTRGSDESFSAYILRITNNPQAAKGFTAHELFPSLDKSDEQIKKEVLAEIKLSAAAISPKIYLPACLQEMQKKGCKVRGLVEQSLKSIQHYGINITRYLSENMPRFEIDEATLYSLEQQYGELLANDVKVNVDFKRKGSEHLLLQTTRYSFLIKEYAAPTDFFDIEPVEGNELEKILGDPSVPLVKLTNVSDYLELADIIEIGTTSYKNMCILKENGVIDQGSE